MTKKPAIGIDLGTTYSCAGVFNNGNVHILSNDHGRCTTPSIVAYHDGEWYVGDTVNDTSSLPQTNVIHDSKRLMGRKFDHPSVQSLQQRSVFQLVNNGSNVAKIKVPDGNNSKELYAEEVGAKILSSLKDLAETYLKAKVTEAVITVPAYFDDLQRQATIDAGKIAGLNILAIVNEPTAAAIAYGNHWKLANNKTILVYDLGGGTFDVSIVAITDGLYTVRATSGNAQLGGQDFTNNMVDFFVDQFNRTHNIDLKTDKVDIRKLTGVCEDAKRALSRCELVPVIAIDLKDGFGLIREISRQKFNSLCETMFNETIEILKDVLSEAKLDKSQIDEIVLVGGSTRIPAIQEMLTKLFDGKKLMRDIHPDEAVAYGAALRAEELSKCESKGILVDVIPISLGVSESKIGRMRTITRKNTPVPCSNTSQFTTYRDNQTEVLIKIYQGENRLVKANTFLGEFELSELPPLPAGEIEIDITLSVNMNGVLTIAAVHTSKECSKRKVITINKKSESLPQIELDRLIAESRQWRHRIGRRLELASIANRLERATLGTQLRSANTKNFAETPLLNID